MKKKGFHTAANAFAREARVSEEEPPGTYKFIINFLFIIVSNLYNNIIVNLDNVYI